ncbi:MAG: ParB N-terminal domain-containing protein [bacterium]|nr:ParB N-terminal domain-containing protein [bacterium]
MMETNPGPRAEYIKIEIRRIGDRYSCLRMVDPRSDVAMVRSMGQYGQLSPVVVCGSARGRYEMIDGFKRLRAGRRLEWPRLVCRVLDVGKHALKAAIIHLNMKGKTIADLERGMVIHSLFHEDGLKQVQIAELLGRHKSWVCRRLALVERLSDEVLENLKLGLINTTTGRELAKLPRGNQNCVLESVLEHRLRTKETGKLVSILLREPSSSHEKILLSPREKLHVRQPNNPAGKRSTPSAMTLDTLVKINRILKSKEFGENHFSKIEKCELRPIQYKIERIRILLTQISIRAHKGEVFEEAGFL